MPISALGGTGMSPDNFQSAIISGNVQVSSGLRGRKVTISDGESKITMSLKDVYKQLNEMALQPKIYGLKPGEAKLKLDQLAEGSKFSIGKKIEKYVGNLREFISGNQNTSKAQTEPSKVSSKHAKVSSEQAALQRDYKDLETLPKLPTGFLTKFGNSFDFTISHDVSFSLDSKGEITFSGFDQKDLKELAELKKGAKAVIQEVKNGNVDDAINLLGYLSVRIERGKD